MIGFHIFTNPVEIHRYFEKQLDEFMKGFQQSGFGDGKLFSQQHIYGETARKRISVTVFRNLRCNLVSNKQTSWLENYLKYFSHEEEKSWMFSRN